MQPAAPPQPPTAFDKFCLVAGIVVLTFGIPLYLETFSLFWGVGVVINVLGVIRVLGKMNQYNKWVNSQPNGFAPPSHPYAQSPYPPMGWPQQPPNYPYPPQPQPDPVNPHPLNPPPTAPHSPQDPQSGSPSEHTGEPPNPVEGAYSPPPPPPYQVPTPNYASHNAAYAPGYPPSGVMPAAKLSKLAEASLGLAILGLCTGLASIGAVICGHLALSEIKKPNALLRGREMAIAGLVLGYLEIVAYIVLIGIVAATNASHR